MGVMRFIIEPAEMIREWPEAYRAYVSGFDGHVFPTRIEIDGNVLNCRRPTSESGKLHVAWPVAGQGKVVLPTSSLRERDEPYILALELARGKICEFREQAVLWEQAGLEIPLTARQFGDQAFRQFARAASNQEDSRACSEMAREAIHLACQAADAITRTYAHQRLSSRAKRLQHTPIFLGCGLPAAIPPADWDKQFCGPFSVARVPMEWRLIEPEEGTYEWEVIDGLVDWCQERRLNIIGGPLLDLSSGGLPEWLGQWSHDFLNFQSFVRDFVETVLSRFTGRIRQWEVTARANTGGALALSEEHRLTLAARTIETAKHIDDEGMYCLRVDQPWGVYQARGQHRLSPFQFVDAIHRANVGLSGVILEIQVGYRQRSCGCRDLLSVSQLIDRWSVLGLPLQVCLSYPSSAEPDGKASPELEVDDPCWRGGWNEQSQADWLENFLPLLMAKPMVGGVSWDHFSDGYPHLFPNGGLVRGDSKPKMILKNLQVDSGTTVIDR